LSGLYGDNAYQVTRGYRYRRGASMRADPPTFPERITAKVALLIPAVITPIPVKNCRAQILYHPFPRSVRRRSKIARVKVVSPFGIRN